MQKIPWTKLEGSALWEAAEAAHQTPDWRVFHGFGHPKQLYWHAEHTFGFPHCPDLDEAILMHDVIFDCLAEPERRSADWAASRGATQKSVDLIMSTAGHTPCKDNRMILLDLSNLMFDDQRITGTQGNREEFIRRTKGTDAEFSEKTAKYLSGLQARITAGLDASTPPGDGVYFDRILRGIEGVLEDLMPQEMRP